MAMAVKVAVVIPAPAEIEPCSSGYPAAEHDQRNARR
jgi:hypothetical protein